MGDTASSGLFLECQCNHLAEHGRPLVPNLDEAEQEKYFLTFPIGRLALWGSLTRRTHRTWQSAEHDPSRRTDDTRAQG